MLSLKAMDPTEIDDAIALVQYLVAKVLRIYKKLPNQLARAYEWLHTTTGAGKVDRVRRMELESLLAIDDALMMAAAGPAAEEDFSRNRSAAPASASASASGKAAGATLGRELDEVEMTANAEITRKRTLSASSELEALEQSPSKKR